MSSCVLAQIEDPVRDYTEKFALHCEAEIYILQLDVSGDGESDLLIARSDRMAGKSGYIWKVYVKEKATYRPVEDLMVFGTGSYYLQSHPEFDSPIIVSYFPAGAGESSITCNRLKEGTVVRDALAQSRNTEELKQQYDSMLTDKARIRVKKFPLSIILQRYPIRVYTDSQRYLLGTLDPSEIVHLDSNTTRPANLALSGDNITSQGIVLKNLLELDAIKNDIAIVPK
jgi:hypothetical protein